MQDIFCCCFSPNASNLMLYFLLWKFPLFYPSFCSWVEIAVSWPFPKVEKESGQWPNHQYFFIEPVLGVRSLTIRSPGSAEDLKIFFKKKKRRKIKRNEGIIKENSFF